MSIIPFIFAAILIASIIGFMRPASAVTHDNSFDRMFGDEISGKFVSRDGAIEIQFPSDWSGFTFLDIPIVSPDGINLSSNSSKTVMMVISLNRTLLADWGGRIGSNFESLAQNGTISSEHCSTQSYS